MAISIESLSVSRGGVNLLQGVDIELKNGQAGILRGPNGVGKTTLLRALAGLQPVESGTIKCSLEDICYSGHADGVYDGAVLEIKTMRNYGFRKARQEGPKEEHLFQACAYALGLGLTEIHLVYVCTDATPSRWKDSARAGDMVEWRYDIHDSIDESGTSILVATTYFLEQHAQMAKNYLTTGVIPEGLKSWWNDEVPWECNYCSHYDICEQHGDVDMLDNIDLVIKETDESVK